MKNQMRKTCLVFVFDGFADHEVTLAMAGIRKSGRFQVKTIALSKEPVTAQSGLTIVPDFDFLSAADLADIDPDVTAMLILPDLATGEHCATERIGQVVAHCSLLAIPVETIANGTLPWDVARRIFETLGISEQAPTNHPAEYLLQHVA